jgi:hypothetical protein
MSSEIAGRFWSGPIQSEGRARQIIDAAGWVFVGFGALSVVSSFPSFAAGGRLFLGALITALIFLLPGGFLLTRRNQASAIAQFVASLLLTAIVILGVFAVASFVRGAAFLIALIPLAIFLFINLLCWRAVVAARYLSRLTSVPVSA